MDPKSSKPQIPGQPDLHVELSGSAQTSAAPEGSPPDESIVEVHYPVELCSFKASPRWQKLLLESGQLCSVTHSDGCRLERGGDDVWRLSQSNSSVSSACMVLSLLGDIEQVIFDEQTRSITICCSGCRKFTYKTDGSCSLAIDGVVNRFFTVDGKEYTFGLDLSMTVQERDGTKTIQRANGLLVAFDSGGRITRLHYPLDDVQHVRWLHFAYVDDEVQEISDSDGVILRRVGSAWQLFFWDRARRITPLILPDGQIAISVDKLTGAVLIRTSGDYKLIYLKIGVKPRPSGQSG
jgi:hypothetical protein